MITGELRSKVDKIWETFWSGGITNPLEVIEQFTYLLFIKGLDDKETIKENDYSVVAIRHCCPDEEYKIGDIIFIIVYSRERVKAFTSGKHWESKRKCYGSLRDQ